MFCVFKLVPPAPWSPPLRSLPRWGGSLDPLDHHGDYLSFWEIHCISRVGHFIRWMSDDGGVFGKLMWYWPTWCLGSGVGGWGWHMVMGWFISAGHIWPPALPLTVCVLGLCAHPPWRECPICNLYFRRGCKQRSRRLCAVHVFVFVPISMEHISTDHPYSLDISHYETFQRGAKWQLQDIPTHIYVWKGKWRRTGRSQHSQGWRRGKKQQGPEQSRVWNEVRLLCKFCAWFRSLWFLSAPWSHGRNHSTPDEQASRVSTHVSVNTWVDERVCLFVRMYVCTFE